jgi:hypothetical protein
LYSRGHAAAAAAEQRASGEGPMPETNDLEIEV